MSHVDEGALHAYLDGALDEYPAAEARRIRDHIETCAVCAEALSAERMVREEAHAILDFAAPAVQVPTFEELRAYVVSTSRTEGKTTSRRLYRLSWAASVVLALGSGWMLRGGNVVPISPLERFDAQGARELQEAPAEAAAAVDPAASAANDVANRALGAETDAVEPQPFQRPSTPEVPANVLADVPASAVDAAGDFRALGAASATGARLDVAPAPTTLADAQGGQGYRPVSGRDFADAVTQGAPVAGQAAAGPPPAAPAPAQAPDTRVTERIDSAARANQPERRVEATPDVVVTSAIDAAAAAQGAPARQREENERTSQDEEGESLVVPGLEVLDVLPVGQSTTFAGMRALQRLESGDTLELTHLPAGIDPSFLPPLRPGMNELVRQRGDGWLVMRGPVTERYLQELLQRLEGAR